MSKKLTALEQQLLNELEQSEKLVNELYAELKEREEAYTTELKQVTKSFEETVTYIKKSYEDTLTALESALKSLERRLT